MVTVKVSLPEYLAQWAICKLGNITENGKQIVVPVKGSPLSQFLRNFLMHKKKRPEGLKSLGNDVAVKDGISSLEIAVPHFPGRDPNYYNYLSPTVEAQLRDLIRSRFDCQLFTDFSRFKNVEMPLKDFIYSWIEANGIEMEERNWLAVDKRLQLLRRRASDRIRKKSKNLP